MIRVTFSNLSEKKNKEYIKMGDEQEKLLDEALGIVKVREQTVRFLLQRILSRCKPFK